MSENLIQIEHLKQFFPAGGYGKKKKYIRAVDDVFLYHFQGRNLRTGGRVRVRKDHYRQNAAPAL